MSVAEFSQIFQSFPVIHEGFDATYQAMNSLKGAVGFSANQVTVLDFFGGARRDDIILVQRLHSFDNFAFGSCFSYRLWPG